MPATHQPSTRPNVTLAAAWLVVMLSTALSDAAAPTLSHLFPGGGARGAKVAVTATGTFDWPPTIWAPGVVIVAEKDKGKLTVAIPADFAADRVWIRFHNSEGVSKLAPFLIGTLPETIEAEPNNAPSAAQVVEKLGIIINGALKESADVDGFVTTLRKGETLVAAVEANDRLGSPMDAILQIATPDGFVLADNHDHVGLDPMLAFTAPKDGKYIARLFAFPANPDTSIAFRASADFVYRLTLTTGPYVTHVAPMAAPLANPGTALARGWNIPKDLRLPVTKWGGSSSLAPRENEPWTDARSSSASLLGLAWSANIGGGARVRLTPHPVLPGVTASDAAKPVSLAPPVALMGWLAQPRRTDDFLAPLKKGQPMLIAAESHGLGLRVQPTVRLFDPNGKQAAIAQPIELGDAVLVHTPANDGVHRIEVSDLFQRGGELAYYQLTVRPIETDFFLSAAADKLEVAADKPTEFVITVRRQAGMGETLGPIVVSAVDLPAGVTAPAVTSEPTGPTAAKVTLKFTSTAGALTAPIRIVGKADKPRPMERVAVAPANLGACLDTIWLTAKPKK